MANHRSAAKRARQSVKKEAVNQQRLRRVRTIEKKLLVSLKEQKLDAAKELLPVANREMAKAAKSRVVTKGRLARRISRLSSQIYGQTVPSGGTA